jgi:hypothetical protein
VGPGYARRDVAGTFVIVAADWKVVLEQAVSLVQRAFDVLFHQRFRQRPDRAVTVTLWSTAAGYDAYCSTRVGSACGDDRGVSSGRARTSSTSLPVSRRSLTHSRDRASHRAARLSWRDLRNVAGFCRSIFRSGKSRRAG